MNWLANLLRRPARSVVRRSHLALESLEDRQLLSSTPVTPVLLATSGITGAEVKQIASLMYSSGHQLTSQDTILLFDVVDGVDIASIKTIHVGSKTEPAVTLTETATTTATGKISASALQELDKIFGNPTAWGMSSTLASEGEQVLHSVKADATDDSMRHAVNQVFHITSSQSSGTTGGTGTTNKNGWNQTTNNQFSWQPI
jgi:hypothetical protein